MTARFSPTRSPANISAFFSNDYETFVRVVKTSCIQSRKVSRGISPPSGLCPLLPMLCRNDAKGTYGRGIQVHAGGKNGAQSASAVDARKNGTGRNRMPEFCRQPIAADFFTALRFFGLLTDSPLALAFRCCGPALAISQMNRLKRGHASGISSTSLVRIGFAMTGQRTNIRRLRKAFGEHLEEYHVAAGEFVTSFFNGRGDAVANSVDSGALGGTICTGDPKRRTYRRWHELLIRRIAEAEKWDENKWRDWKRLLDQLGSINRLRNDLLHYGAAIAGDVWVVSNERVAHTAEKIREIRITSKTLNAATADLGAINLLLTYFGGERGRHRLRRELPVVGPNEARTMAI